MTAQADWRDALACLLYRLEHRRFVRRDVQRRRTRTMRLARELKLRSAA